MKPDWKDAPEWAQYLARDENGAWYWFEREPVEGVESWHCVGGEMKFAGQESYMVSECRQ